MIIRNILFFTFCFIASTILGTLNFISFTVMQIFLTIIRIPEILTDSWDTVYDTLKAGSGTNDEDDDNNDETQEP